MDTASRIGKRVAFFGGSFDPPHLGHLAVARAAQSALTLDSVLFAPVGVQPLKPNGLSACFEDRLAMTRLAIEHEQGFAVSLADAPTVSVTPNYTLDTLLELRADLPQDGALFCLMGADSFASLKQWHGAAQIPFVAPLIVASRPGEQLDHLMEALPSNWKVELDPSPHGSGSRVVIQSYSLRNTAGGSTSLYLLPGLQIEISASRIREQLRADRFDYAGVCKLLPQSVADYIRSHGLYR